MLMNIDGDIGMGKKFLEVSKEERRELMLNEHLLKAMPDFTHVTHNYLLSLSHLACMVLETRAFTI